MLTRDSQAGCPWNETGHVYTSVRSSGNVNVTLPRCSFHEGRYGQPLPSGGVFVEADARAFFGESDIGSVVPKPGDRHTPPGGRAHVVLTVVHARRNRFYKVACRDLVLAYDLRATGSIFRPTTQQTASGLRTFTETEAVVTDAPCRLQPESNDVERETDGAVMTRRRYTLFIDTAYDLTAGDVVVVGEGVYEVTGQTDRDQYDTLTRVRCERIT